ncbi:MAG: fibrobacter succinogenes major paralogous domain-containing protein [Prevotellaceae bacterium]|jgi:hypothetical protein|nr:fibrobacter succinogenes major paralogous domain-containing protein [Prevotellaceae bacterium]
MKTNLFLFAALTAAFLSVASFSAAQVTIGGSDAPKAGAILDLNSTTKGGLQLSNVSITDLGKIPVGFPGINIPDDVTDEVKAKLTGAIVYNTYEGLQIASQLAGVAKFGKGIYVWNGNQWNKIGKSEQAITLTFAPYNLGADPTYNTPKKQIEYLATCNPSTTDATVIGDLYQWGRRADGHEKRATAAYGGDGNATNQGALSGADLDVTTGQVANTATGKYGHFIKTNSSYDFDWRSPQMDELWGNGEGLVGQTDNQGGVLHTDGKYYQNTDWAIPENNPCVSMGAGWRVPTQDEWERLCNYDSNPSSATGDITMTATGQANSSANSAPLTWVPVAGGKVSDSWGSSQGALGGYAVYKKADWDAADVSYTGGVADLFETAAPEPVLFLPAAGYRAADIGTFSDLGNIGVYLSSTVSDSRIHSAYITKNFVYPHNNNYRASGLSVRCVK